MANNKMIATNTPGNFEYFSSADLLRLAVPGSRLVYVLIAVVPIDAHNDVPNGSIGLNSIQRKYLRVSTGDKISVERIILPENSTPALLTHELDYVSRARATNEQIDAVAVTELLKRRLVNQVLTVGQKTTFEYLGNNFIIAVIKQAEVEGEGNTDKIEAYTYIIFEGIPAHATSNLGIKHVEGMLLNGPPGTGKTLMTRQISKMSNGKDPKIVNGPKVLSKFLGETKNIRDSFADAEQDQKTRGDQSDLHVIIFDEIDPTWNRQLAGNQNDDFDWSALLNEDINGVAGADDEFFKPKSPIEYSDIEEEDNDIATTAKEREVKNRIQKKLVPIYVDNAKGWQKKAEIDMDRCKGYYSIALEILEKKDDDSDSLPHVGWPWAPDYGIAKYYSEDWESELNPLTISWQSFESCLGNILIFEKDEGDIIPVEIIDQDGDVESTLVLCRSVLTSSELLLKALNFYSYADAGIEVREMKLKKQPWWPYTCVYYDQNDEAIIPPYEPFEVEDMGEVVGGEKAQFAEDEEGGVEQEEDDGGVSQDEGVAAVEEEDNEEVAAVEEAEIEMEVVVAAVEEAEIEMEVEVAAVEVEDQEVEFMSRLARVRVLKKDDVDDADIQQLLGERFW